MWRCVREEGFISSHSILTLMMVFTYDRSFIKQVIVEALAAMGLKKGKIGPNGPACFKL